MNDLYTTIKSILKRELTNIHTITVAKVTKVNDSTINCQPVINRVFKDKSIPMPEFAEVPVIFLQGGESHHSFPIKTGDYCLLFVCERSFDRWHNGEDNMSPLTSRMFNYSDSFAIVGVCPKAQAIAIPDRITQIGDTLANGNYEQNGDYTHTGNTEHTGNYTLTGDMVINGNLTVNGNITCSGVCAAPTIATNSIIPFPGSSVTPSVGKLVVTESLNAGGVEMITHTHDAPSGGGSTGAPR